MKDRADSPVPTEGKLSPVGGSWPLANAPPARRPGMLFKSLPPLNPEGSLNLDPDGFDDICNEDTPKRPLLTSPPRSHRHIVEKWCQERNVPSEQIVGVLRHTERGDSSWALVNGTFWHRTKDFELWPLDPPLSDNGLKAAQQLGHQVRHWVQEVGTEIHIVVSSPFLRCVQTAVEVCCELGPGTRLLIDRGLGEIYGSCLMPGLELSSEADIVRPVESTFALCRQRGVACEHECVGNWPTRREDLRAARRRFATRYLTYVRRSVRVRRNFLIVSHADCVGAALSMMPSEAGSIVEKVGYGGMFLAHRELQAAPVASRRRISAPGKLESSPKQVSEQNPFSSEGSVETDFVSEGPNFFSSEESSNHLDSDDSTFTRRLSFGSVISEDSPLRPSTSNSFGNISASAGDAWKVETFGISQMPSEDLKNAVLQRRLNDLVKDGCFSRQMIEKLLFRSLSESPLGAEDTISGDNDAGAPRWDGLEFRSLHLSRTSSFTNSTLLFGSSSTNVERLAQVPSRASTLSSFDAASQEGSDGVREVQKASTKSLIRSATRTLSFDSIDEESGDHLLQGPPITASTTKTSSNMPDTKIICLTSSSNSRIAKRRSSEKLTAPPVGMPPLFYAAKP